MLISWRSADRGCQTREGWEKLGIFELNVSISRKRRDVFLKRCKRYGYCPDDFPNISELVSDADDQLFSRISHNVTHVLKPLLPTNTHHSFNLRDRRHNFVLIENNSKINHWHFIIRQLYKYS